MKVLQINSVCGKGSTGKICIGISEILNQNGIDNKIFYFSGNSDNPLAERFSTDVYIRFQSLKSHALGNYGFNSRKSTYRLINAVKEYDPDIVHIHNIHGHDVDFEKLLVFLKSRNKKIVYTFHDCWAFTGYCPYFDLVKCEKWRSKCEKCPLKKDFSFFFDKSGKNFERKKKALSGLDMTIVTPSKWLAGLVGQSFLKDYPVEVINNGIDLSVFKPTKGDFRKRYDISDDNFVLLGVAFDWGIRKGLDVFIKLSKSLPENYRIVLVGTNKKIDKLLPKNIISIHRTHNQEELAEIYTAADLFVNPTREEVFGLVNVEALACGTPVLTFNTGGSPEIIDETCGSVVECDDVASLEKEIIKIQANRPFSEKACLSRAQAFDEKSRFQEYVSLYKSTEND